jgi:hypothetical protein
VEVLVPVITAVITFVVTAAATFVTTRRNLQLEYDADLRKLRIDAYLDLWQRLEVLSKYARPNTLARAEAQALAQSLRDWYFKKGGLYLSVETRADYFAMQDALSVLATGGAVLNEGEDEFLRVLGSQLRTGMTRDVGTRQTFLFRRDKARAPEFSQPRTYVDSQGGGELRLAVRRAAPLAGARRPPVARVNIARRGRGSDHTREEPWDPARSSFALAIEDESGRPDERIFLAEDDVLIEGPKGWARSEPHPRGTPVIWERRA